MGNLDQSNYELFCKSMRVFFSTLGFFILFSNSVTARIGETKRECIKRYGEIMNHKYKPNFSTVLVFEKNGFVVIVNFSDRNTVQKITYKKVGIGEWEKISKEECKALLDVNSKGKKWLLEEDMFLTQRWTVEDRSLWAWHRSMYSNRSVTIVTDYFSEKVKAEEKEDARRLAEGL